MAVPKHQDPVILGNLRTVVLPNGDRIDHLVEGAGWRIGKKVDGVLERAWLYLDDLHPVTELDGNGIDRPKRYLSRYRKELGPGWNFLNE